MYSYDDEPICACSTPAGISGIAVIRISGNGCGKLADKCSVILRSSGDYSKLSELPGYTCAFGYVKDPSNGIKVDEVIFTHFEAPHSYTGEEMVEISSHGSGAVKQEILKCLGMSGIRMAYPGEFSRRAFINGKMSLASAEAVMDVINSETERQLEAAGSLMSGKLAEEIDYIERNLYDQAAMLETFTEFDTEDPDEEEAKLETVKDNLSDCHDRLTTLCKGYGKGRILSERLRVALLGLPNSGKSTLLNTLTGFDRAIVTEVAGTTRDTIEVQLNINGIPVTLIDTAGIRETDDIIESMGIGKAYEAGRGSDMIFYMIPPDMTADEAYSGVKGIIEDCESVTAVFSKSDAGENPDREEIETRLKTLGIESFISISAEEDLNIDKLEDVIIDYYNELGGGASEGLLITNSRHYSKFLKASKKLALALDALDNNLGTEVCASALRACLDEIGEVTGKTVSATLADTIFSRFCIGK
ncbi:MAG: tRNA uridine-5-carboxymethylaminomethyl(34) synthesis GTPase MnmE [Clostridiales bacterium]|jgi:tRNA modification GTPase|nr:tRNA uridine-5-carboxymethylaminomethyl(34) synthesis GTPase MnmE [Clostridiales bacterium]MBQ5768217.1 tRNA uridine-5-carboxymethylaminomethyl(34) synthesis GTPase MnmE [Clostridiales bacterium]